MLPTRECTSTAPLPGLQGLLTLARIAVEHELAVGSVEKGLHRKSPTSAWFVYTGARGDAKWRYSSEEQKFHQFDAHQAGERRRFLPFGGLFHTATAARMARHSLWKQTR